MTVYFKRVFPTIWFGFLAFMVVMIFSSGAAKRELIFLVIPCVMAIFGFFMMKKLLWDLADCVEDGGDFLLIKNRGEQDRVMLSNVMNVSVSQAMNPPRITLKLIEPGKFGNEISFSPATDFALNPFSKNKIAEDLIVRVDRARLRRAV